METAIDLDSEDLTLIDSGIQDLKDIPLHRKLQSLNIHCNHIVHIRHLDQLHALKHLDLSANQITRIQGLGGLVSLRTVNLASNLIEVVEGLQGLRNLVKVNLSYNRLSSIDGFKSVAGPEYKLTHIELQGNQLQSVQHVVQSLKGCVNLRNLILNQAGSSNPLCNTGDFSAILWSNFPQLHALDNKDKYGRDTQTDDILADIPGLEQFMDYLLSNGNTENDPVAVATPNIDAALDLFRQRGVTTSEVSTTDMDTSGATSGCKQNLYARKTTPTKKINKEPVVDHEDRLDKLENQLSRLLQASEDSIKMKQREAGLQSPRRLHNRNKPDSDDSDPEPNSPVSSKDRKPSGASYLRTAGVPKSKRKNKLTNVETTSSASSQAGGRGVRGKKTGDSRSQGIERVRVVNPIEGATATVTDIQRRDDLQTTYVSLMRELESERERRWKSEEATKKLAEHVRQYQEKAREGQEIQDVAMQATTRLKQALTNEREVKLKMQAQLELSQEQLNEVEERLKKSQKNEESLRSSLRSMEESAARLEAEKLKQLAQETKKSQEADMRAAAARREAEMLNSTVETLKGQLRQLQELLAAREQEHRKQLENRHPVESREVQELISREAERRETQHVTELRLTQEKMDSLTKRYSELEDEFRMALQIEAARFKQLQDAYEASSREASETKQALITAQKKDEASSHVITELTSMVKEQKGRITELTKSKHEQTADLKERIETLEAHLEEARKRMITLEMLKQERNKLSSQTQAQESVIEGLKSERKLWGQELAQQGASLAQDRGRLESKIETYSAEIGSLKKQLERETDTVKIKTKILDDQTETIKKLKDALMERDGEIRTVRDENLRIQKDMDQQTSAEAAVNQELQEKLDRARERKEELKQQITELEEQLEASKRAQGILNNKWKDKSTLIGQLEQQVHQMKATWEAKEKKLSEDRDNAIHAASLAVEKMRSMDDSFRKQIDTKESSHQEALKQLTIEKQEEIDMAHRRVAEVEDEMRILLRETDSNKRAMEDRVKRLNRAFSDLQQDLI